MQVTGVLRILDGERLVTSNATLELAWKKISKK